MSNDFRNEQRSTTLEAPPSALSTATNLQDQTTSPSEEMSKVYVKPLIAELIGTFVFVFIGAGSIITNTLTHGAIGLLGIALAHGLALAIVITIFAATSGGHINPAVTIAMLVTRRIAPLLGILYIVAQLVGATLAGLLLQAIYPQAVWQAAQLGTPNLAPGVSFGTGVLVEAVLTFFLLLAVFGTAVDPRAPKIGGFGIGLTVLVDILVGGALTGAAMNPARAFGPALAGGFWQNALVYWIGPIIGAVIAALIYEYVILRAWRAGHQVA
ncbi:MAG: MIP/aquaporin family protein [Ktedonobacteraceae bacterium]